MKLDQLPARFPGVPRLALTATADPQTREDIRRRLKLEGALLFLESFDRPNIRYAIALKQDPRRQLLAFIRAGHLGQSGIVYCLSRAKTKRRPNSCAAGRSRPCYHASRRRRAAAPSGGASHRRAGPRGNHRLRHGDR